MIINRWYFTDMTNAIRKEKAQVLNLHRNVFWCNIKILNYTYCV